MLTQLDAAGAEGKSAETGAVAEDPSEEVVEVLTFLFGLFALLLREQFKGLK